MKEVTRISLASLPYDIEVEAKKAIEKYLHAIEVSLDADSDTMKEIEARIVELLTEGGVSKEMVIGMPAVERVKQQMGEPKEFIGEPDEVTRIKQPKRLMRSEGDEILGGVSSGLAAYFGIDTVWVRLAWVVLTFVTSGFMILVYIVLWIVMPPAKTAADRLQMKGKPVTLAGLQAESELVVRKRKNDQIALTILRISAGIASLLMGIGALAAVVVAWWSVTSQQIAQITGYKYHWIYFGLLVGAGLLLALLCWLGAYMLFTKRSSKRLFMSVGVVTVLGLTSFVAGIVPLTIGLQSETSKAAAEYSKTIVAKRLEAPSLVGIKSIELDSTIPIQVNYNGVNDREQEATLWYNTRNTKAQPTVTFDRRGDVLHVALATTDESCFPDVTRCRQWYTLTIVGPMLESITATRSNAVRYMTDSQPTLATLTRADGRVEVQSTGVIDRLTARLENESRIDMTQASLTQVDLTITDALSNATFATVDSLAISVPNACAANHGGGTIAVTRARLISVNGQFFDESYDYPCITIQTGR